MQTVTRTTNRASRGPHSRAVNTATESNLTAVIRSPQGPSVVNGSTPAYVKKKTKKTKYRNYQISSCFAMGPTEEERERRMRERGGFLFSRCVFFVGFDSLRRFFFARSLGNGGGGEREEEEEENGGDAREPRSAAEIVPRGHRARPRPRRGSPRPAEEASGEPGAPQRAKPRCMGLFICLLPLFSPFLSLFLHFCGSCALKIGFLWVFCDSGGSNWSNFVFFLSGFLFFSKFLLRSLVYFGKCWKVGFLLQICFLAGNFGFVGLFVLVFLVL